MTDLPSLRVPRLCGDGPTVGVSLLLKSARSPPVRGWPDDVATQAEACLAFPACAGMARLRQPLGGKNESVPRLCGDGPIRNTGHGKTERRSPPVRGWPVVGPDTFVLQAAFPACAGMARSRTRPLTE